MRRWMIAASFAAFALVALSGPAAGALDGIVTARGWTQVDYAEHGECRAEVRGNGQFYRIAGQGVRPGEVVQLRLQNEDIKPIAYRITANDDGAWRNFYVPFLWHRDGGIVEVALASETCSLNLSFAWARRRL